MTVLPYFGITIFIKEIQMKRILGVIAVICAIFLIVGCASDKPAKAAQGGMPTWVNDLRKNAPEDVIVGIGTAKLATVNQSMTVSETRARGQIVRAMNSMVKSMIEDYTVSSEVQPSAAVAFQQQIEVSLAKAQLQGARIVEQNSDQNGQWWTVVYFNRSNTRNEINQAQAAAKLAVPAMLAFNAETRMDEKFEQAAKETWLGVSD
jgi:hypothetical protein